MSYKQKGYCIIVEGFSIEKKKRVMDAFESLGFNVDLDENDLIKAKRLNTIDMSGTIRSYVLWSPVDISEKQKPYLITYDELMKEAGMDTEGNKVENMKDKTFTGKIAEWGLPDGTVVYDSMTLELYLMRVIAWMIE